MLDVFFLIDQAQAFSGLSSITWGGADGRNVGISRDPGEIGYLMMISPSEHET